MGIFDRLRKGRTAGARGEDSPAERFTDSLQSLFAIMRAMGATPHMRIAFPIHIYMEAASEEALGIARMSGLDVSGNKIVFSIRTMADMPRAVEKLLAFRDALDAYGGLTEE